MATTTELHTQVTQLYVALFGRAPDLEGLNYWTGQLESGRLLSSVADAMYATTPARVYYPAGTDTLALVNSFYVHILGRTADFDGLLYWASRIDNGSGTTGQVLATLLDTAAHYTGTDPAGLTSAAYFNNRVAVALHYAEAGGGISQATSILALVTSDPATATAAINAIDGHIPPQFVSAAVNGGTLVMTYSDALQLDAAHPPATGAFTVTVAGVARALSGVAVDAAAKTVTLTLASAVATGETVTVAYTDPTSGNDASAIQNANGTDAATLAATAVTNNTPDATAPAFASASVSGTSLVMTYTDASPLDATHVPSVNAFTVMVAGAARSVTAVAVDASAKTVTLTLASAVTGGQIVTVAYTDPTTSDDANAIQDASGNDAATLAATAVANSAADTTGPLFVSATVDGATLVMTYIDTSPIDPFHPPAAGAFTVKVAGVVRAVNSVKVDSAGTVTLTLASAVANGQAVTVAYTDPTSGDDAAAIQDAFGNDAASLSAKAVTNVTADTTGPVFASAAVSGSTLVMTYTDSSALDAVNTPAAGAFAVKVAGVARSVSSVSVDATAKTVTLTLASAVTNGQAVTVAYTDPTSGNDAHAIQDAQGNDAASLSATAATNNTADVTAPVFASAAVNGASLVMTYTELNLLDATHVPATTAFTVMVAGVARTVDAVAVNANAKTVTLTLASAVTAGQAVTVAYADPTVGNDANAIQDATGNDAASLAATSVTNNTAAADSTAPVFASAAVNDASLVMTYTELNLLDAVNTPVAGDFAVMVDGVSRGVNAVSVDANAKTVTLTLASAVTAGQAVTVAYADPTVGDDANAIQDATGNDAASLAATSVTNNTAAADSTAPVFASAAVNDASLVMTYTELNLLDAVNTPVAGDFAVMVEGVSRGVNAVSVDANAKTVTLTLASAVANGEAVTVAYTDPTGGNDANAIQDATGNDAATLAATAVTNNTPDTTAPVFVSAGVNGDTLVMGYTELNLLDAVNTPVAGDFAVMVEGVSRGVNAVSVDANAKIVTLTLASAVVSGEAVTVAYTDPTAGDDTNAIQDASGNDAATFGATVVTNISPDTTPPVFASATVNGSSLVMSYTDAGPLDATFVPGTGDFAVLVDGVADAVIAVIVDAVTNTVTLGLTTGVTAGQIVTMSYTDPTAGDDFNAIQDASGNDAVSLVGVAVTNVS